jgi:pyruvate,orthophosphate dikinase
MFFAEDRIKAVREMILSDDEAGRRKALAKILPLQKGDFYDLMKELQGMPVTIRFLDPPLHEFLPTEDKDIQTLATEMEVSVETLKAKIASLHELNPMLGHRGCRLAVTYPEIAETQTEAVIAAACELKKE